MCFPENTWGWYSCISFLLIFSSVSFWDCYLPSILSLSKRDSRGKLIYTDVFWNWASQVALVIKNPSGNKRHRFYSWIGKIPWRRKWQPTRTEEPGRPWSMGLQRLGHNWASEHILKSVSSLYFLKTFHWLKMWVGAEISRQDVGKVPWALKHALDVYSSAWV